MKIPLLENNKYVINKGTTYQYDSTINNNKYFANAIDMMLVEIRKIVAINDHFMVIEFNLLNADGNLFYGEITPAYEKILIYDDSCIQLPVTYRRMTNNTVYDLTTDSKFNSYPLSQIQQIFFNVNDEIYKTNRKISKLKSLHNARVNKLNEKYVELLYNARIEHGEKRAYDKEIESFI